MEVEIKRYPMSMTGAKLRKKLGLRVYGKKNFKIHSDFRFIPKDGRLAFLRARIVRSGRKDMIAFRRMNQMRQGFNSVKFKNLPMKDDCKCYVCGSIAVLRHHVHPISRGGRNGNANIVPLCNSCHKQVHS